nr:hypothetical protein Iba_chr04dCG19450 [Ipomoea batatas]
MMSVSNSTITIFNRNSLANAKRNIKMKEWGFKKTGETALIFRFDSSLERRTVGPEQRPTPEIICRRQLSELELHAILMPKYGERGSLRNCLRLMARGRDGAAIFRFDSSLERRTVGQTEGQPESSVDGSFELELHGYFMPKYGDITGVAGTVFA